MLLHFGLVKRGPRQSMPHKIILFLSLTLCSVSINANEFPTRIGYAFDQNTKELIYTESHYEQYSDETVHKSKVIYKDASDNIFAQKSVDFTKNKYMPEFSLQNDMTGHIEKTRFVESKYEVVFSKLQSNAKKEALINYPEDGISDAGFDNFIINHWEDLLEGEMFVREFLIPSMMDFVKFRIYQDDVVTEDNRKLRIINIEPNSFIIRAFAGTTKLFYDESMPKLVKFDGVSNMRDKKGDNLKVTIQYEEIQKLALN